MGFTDLGLNWYVFEVEIVSNFYFKNQEKKKRRRRRKIPHRVARPWEAEVRERTEKENEWRRERWILGFRKRGSVQACLVFSLPIVRKMGKNQKSGLGRALVKQHNHMIQQSKEKGRFYKNQQKKVLESVTEVTDIDAIIEQADEDERLFVADHPAPSLPISLWVISRSPFEIYKRVYAFICVFVWLSTLSRESNWLFKLLILKVIPLTFIRRKKRKGLNLYCFRAIELIAHMAPAVGLMLMVPTSISHAACPCSKALFFICNQKFRYYYCNMEVTGVCSA